MAMLNNQMIFGPENSMGHSSRETKGGVFYVKRQPFLRKHKHQAWGLDQNGPRGEDGVHMMLQG